VLWDKIRREPWTPRKQTRPTHQHTIWMAFIDNNLRLVMVKTNRPTLHTVYNIQLSATQGSNDTTHRLSRRTAATTRFSTEGIGCQKQTATRLIQKAAYLLLFFINCLPVPDFPNSLQVKPCWRKRFPLASS